MPFAPLPATETERGPIVRVLRSRMSPDEYRTFEPSFDAYVARVADQWRSNFALWWGNAPVDSDLEVVVVSGWEGLGPLRRAQVGMHEASLRHEPGAAFDLNGTGETWQLVDQTATTFEPAAGRVLRLIQVPLQPGREQAFLDHLGPLRAALVETGDLAVSQLALAEASDGPHALLVNVWRDPAAVQRPRGDEPRLAMDLPAGLSRGPVRTDTYDLHPTSILRLAPEGPAILVTDDGGRVVDVTPAASAMLGTEPWDLLDRRLDDLADLHGRATPAFAGRLSFHRPEGGSILLQALGAENVPAPGRNALLLVAGSDPPPGPADLESAIAAAYRRTVESATGGAW